MSDLMYRGRKRFDREQLVYVVEVILEGALDRVCSCLPDCIGFGERTALAGGPAYNVRELISFESGAIEAAGMALAVFYAQLTNDGLAISDALACAGDFHSAVETFVFKAWSNHGNKFLAAQKRLQGQESSLVSELYGPFGYPDCHLHAEEFVNELFTNYLNNND